ncbi:MAG: recombinase family protein [Eubacteriales bacterium]
MEEKVVALYIRLSKADEVTGDSESVKSQRTMLHQFLDNEPDLCDFKRYEAIDDGFSGTNDNRPMFQEMVQRAEKGELQAIVVKDSSRLFRNYTEAGRFMDYNFPMWDVRYIAVGDGYDSDDYKGITGGMDQALRNIIYASYPKMLSRNIKSAQTRLAKQGKYIWSFPPFGYCKHPTDRHKLVIEEEAAAIVRTIFEKALEGKNPTEIAFELNAVNTETKFRYFRRKFPDSKKFSDVNPENHWVDTTVRNIIRNQLYTGTLVSHSRTREEVGGKKTVKTEPIVVESTHEGIVTKEEFELAQKVARTIKRSPSTIRNEYNLRGLARCGHCKKMLDRINKNTGAFFSCRTSRFTSDTSCRNENRYIEADLDMIVYRAISDYVGLLNSTLVVAKSSSEENKIDYHSITKEIAQLEKDIQAQKSLKFQDYERYSSGSISKELFLQRKEKADHKIKELEEDIADKEKTRNCIPDHTSHSTAELEQLVEDFQNSDKLTTALAHVFVKEIFVYDKDTVEIIFNFNDIF